MFLTLDGIAKHNPHAQNSLDSADVRMPLMVMQDCPPPLIYSTTEPVIALVRTGLTLAAFLVSVQQGRALERTQHTSAHRRAYRKEASEMRAPLYSRHVAIVSLAHAVSAGVPL